MGCLSRDMIIAKYQEARDCPASIQRWGSERFGRRGSSRRSRRRLGSQDAIGFSDGYGGGRGKVPARFLSNGFPAALGSSPGWLIVGTARSAATGGCTAAGFPFVSSQLSGYVKWKSHLDRREGPGLAGAFVMGKNKEKSLLTAGVGPGAGELPHKPTNNNSLSHRKPRGRRSGRRPEGGGRQGAPAGESGRRRRLPQPTPLPKGKEATRCTEGARFPAGCPSCAPGS